jgi:HlyD family secretion protein
MRNRKTVILIIAVLALAGAAAAAWRYSVLHPQTVGQLATVVAPPSAPAGLVVSGFIEADEVAIASPLGGRITTLPVEESQVVTRGAVLARLDSSSAEADLAVAQAKVDAARAALAWVQAGPTAENVRQAEAAVTLAQAYRDQAYQAWQDAKMLAYQTQTLDLQIVQAQTQVTVTQQKLDAAAALKDAVQIAKDKFDQDMANLKKQWGDKAHIPSNPYLNQWWGAWAGVNGADASYQGASALLSDLQAEKKWPVAQVAQMHAAEAGYHSAEAAVTQAQARLDDLRAGATAEQIAAAAAQVSVAQADVAAVQAHLNKLTITAPSDGVILQRAVYTGEVAAPGATLMTLADLEAVSLVVYVPEAQLNTVRVGQTVAVRTDSFPGQTFDGQVVRIADQAEFIPDKVQTSEERVALVYAVKIHLSNSGRRLKPGMAADVALAAK